MARVCDITGKKPQLGNHVSHANNKTRRRFLPNLQSRRFWVESENRWVRMRVSQQGLRTIDKKGIDVVLAEMRALGLFGLTIPEEYGGLGLTMEEEVRVAMPLLVPTMDRKFFSVGRAEDIALGGKSVGDIIAEGEFKMNDFAPYIPPSADYLESKGVEVHYLGYYLKWDPQECYYYAVENTGFQANTERTEGTYSKYSSIDDRVDMFHYYTTLIKFGIGRATYDAAQEIRNGKITREEGVQLVRRYDQEFPRKYFQEFLDYISVSEEEFHATVDMFRSPNLWEKRDGEWLLKHAVWKSE